MVNLPQNPELRKLYLATDLLLAVEAFKRLPWASTCCCARPCPPRCAGRAGGPAGLNSNPPT